MVLVGCAGSSRVVRNETAAPPKAAPAVESVAVKAKQAPKVAPRPTAPPHGYVPMRLFNVMRSQPGFTVLLIDDTDRVLPISVGGSEGLAIALRYAGTKFSRPLTHDLIDEVLYELGVKLVKVHIDALVEGVFHGSVHLRHVDRNIEMDSRSSDAIALALGHRVPIYVAKEVLDEAAVKMPKKTKANDATF